MSNFRHLIIGCALGLQCATLTVHASDVEHVNIESRTTPYSERILIQEERALQEKEALETLGGICDEEASFAMIQKPDAATYRSTHLGAYHHPLAITPMGEKIELEDGSIWSTDPNHRYRTLNWMTYDTIIVTMNKDWFSSYLFRLTNVTTGQSVACNMSLGPIVNGVFTHWIISIDYEHRDLCLEDGSVWKLSRLDDKIFKKWLPNDTVIIGINNLPFSCLNPNLLINVNMLNVTRCECLN